jgi:hypothetical protein
MILSFDKQTNSCIYFVFVNAVKVTQPERSIRRKIMRVGEKFRNAGPETLINLNQKEVQLSLDLIESTLNMCENTLTNPIIEDELLKAQFELLHEKLAPACDEIKKKVKHEIS